MNIMDFSGKRIIVAGIGGIGCAVVSMLKMLGARVICVDLKDTEYTYDFSDVASIEQLVQTIVAKEGPVDGLVYAVGIGSVRPLKMTKYDFMLKVMNINFFSFVEMVRVLSCKGNYGSNGLNVVGISAVGAFQGNSTKTAYCASKGAMNAAVRCMAKELAPKKIRVNTVAPGVTDTPMMRSAEEYGAGSEAFKQISLRQYLGPCDPSDIANAVVFLLSELSRKITGTCVPVDGGKLTS